MHPPDVSIIIVTYNSADVIGLCLDSVTSSVIGSTREVFVVDNASKDDSADIVHNRHPWVRLISNAKNRGFAAANNQAIPLAMGRYLFFLNPDTMMDGTCLDSAVHYMDENPHVGLAGAKTVHFDGSPQESVSLRYPGEKHTKGELEGLGGSIACVLGACMIARAELIRELDGFDEDYFLYGEDQDICLRIRQKGFEIGYIDDAVVRHIGGHSEKASPPTEVYKRKTRAEYIFYRKHYRPETIGRITREHRMKARWRIMTIPLTLPFLRDPAAAQEKIVKYRAILQALDEIERTDSKGKA